MVAVGDATFDGSIIFAKNSDREPNEAQELVYTPMKHHPRGSKVKCTYLEIPQVETTYATMISQPFWMWGCEMGTNSEGVTIGNEAVFTKIPYRKEKGLLGMDLIRLALERSNTAKKCIEVITNLLENYGQGGNCGMDHKLYYHNSFIIADKKEAYVLETADIHWGAKKVKDIASISNGLTLGSDLDFMSENLIKYAVDKGWCKSDKDFHFSNCYSDKLYSKFSGCRIRQNSSYNQMKSNICNISPKTMMDILKSHNNLPEWKPGKANMKTVCAHAGGFIDSQSVSSMVSHLHTEGETHWFTGSSSPCTGIFKPYYIDIGEAFPTGEKPDNIYNSNSFWWKHEIIHRWIIKNYNERIKLIKEEQENIQENFILEEAKIKEKIINMNENDKKKYLQDFVGNCYNRALEVENNWLEKIKTISSSTNQPLLHRIFWHIYNKKAQIKLPQ
jgi:dipeptidase